MRTRIREPSCTGSSATPGRWTAFKDSDRVDVTLDGNELPIIARFFPYTVDENDHDSNERNARFIAAANPATVLALLDRIAALEDYEAAFREGRPWVKTKRDD